MGVLQHRPSISRGNWHHLASSPCVSAPPVSKMLHFAVSIPLWTQWGSALRPSLDLSPHEGPAALCLLTRLSQGALWASGSVCSVRGFSSRGLWRPLILGQHLLAATQPQGWARSPCLRLPSAVKGPPVCPRSSFSWLLLTRASGTRPPPCPPLVTGTVSTSHPTLAPGLPSWALALSQEGSAATSNTASHGPRLTRDLRGLISSSPGPQEMNFIILPP